MNLFAIRALVLLGLPAALLASCGDDGGTGGGTTVDNQSSASSGTGAGGSTVAPLSLSFENVPFDTGLSYITDLAFLPDGSGRFMVTDLYGGIELSQMSPGGAQVLFSMAFDDIYAEYDAGQLALAIDPRFSENQFFYVAANLSRTHVVVRRYRLEQGDPEATRSSGVVIVDLQVASSPRWHNITSMGFEDDARMWLLVGDKGIALPNAPDVTKTVAQDPTTILGSLMRIIPSRELGVGGYEPAADIAQLGPRMHPAVYAKGLRSPWQGVYHQGRWFYGEVGLDNIEEINVIAKPKQNFGWPVVEGPCALDIYGHMPDCSRYDDPWIYFDRSSSGRYVLEDEQAVPTGKRSVYAGWIYQPNAQDRYEGRWNEVLVWGDAFVGFMRASRVDGEADGWHIGHMAFPSAWAQGPDGFVYVISLSQEPNASDPENMSGRPSPLRRAVLAP